MHSPLGSTMCLPLFSPIANHWSDVWIVYKLMCEGTGCEPVNGESWDQWV